MADSSKISILLFLFTLLFSSAQIYGRDSQFFNKIPSLSNHNVAPLSAQTQPNHAHPLTKPAAAEQEPTFIPENENGGYGLYGHESGQISPTTATATTNNNEKFNIPTTTTTANNDPNGFLPKYLPKNYNTVAYVTQPEGYTQPQATSNNYYRPGDADAAYVRDQSQGYSASSSERSYYYPTNNYNANGYNSQPQQQSSVDQFKLDQKSNNYNTNPDNSNSYNSNTNSKVEKQGMSDTRFMENGRYFYDINSEANSNRYPFDTATTSSNHYSGGYNSRTFGDQYQYNSNNNGGYNSYGHNDANSYTFQNQGGRYEGQDEEQFQDFQNQRALP